MRNKKISSMLLSGQQGMTLIELMVGMAIGLVVVGAATAALLASRGISGTVSEASRLHQQASYAFRVIGQHVRQAGSVELNLASNKDTTQKSTIPPTATDPVQFEINTNKKEKTITGKDSPGESDYALEVSYMNYSEENYLSENSLFRDCLGEGKDPKNMKLIENKFKINSKRELICAGASASGAQPIIENVDDFKLAYLMQEDDGSGFPVMKKLSAEQVAGKWSQVYGIQVCLDLVGQESIPTSTLTYRDCSNEEKNFDGKMHLVFRSTFLMRSQNQVRF